MSDAATIGDSASTRERLLLSAMHLYAEQGIAAVSLRTISTAAGSKNSAAMHYHFSNRSGVIEALVNMIALELESIAHQVRENSAANPSLRRKFRNALQPLSDLAQTRPWGADAIRFMSRAISENDPEIAAAINPIYEAYWQRLDNKLAQLVPDLPVEARQLRLMFMSVNVIHGMAEVTSLAHTPLGDLSHFTPDELLDHLVDYLIGGFKAPSSVNRPTAT